MAVITPPPGGGQPPESTGSGPAGSESETGSAAPATSAWSTKSQLVPQPLFWSEWDWMPEASPRSFAGMPSCTKISDGVIGIVQMLAGRLRVGIFSINIPEDPRAALRGFASFRGPARELALSLGLSEYELFGAAVLNSEVELMLLRQGFIS